MGDGIDARSARLCTIANTRALLYLGRGYRPSADTPARVPPAIPLEYAGGFGMMQYGWSHHRDMTMPDYLISDSMETDYGSA